MRLTEAQLQASVELGIQLYGEVGKLLGCRLNAGEKGQRKGTATEQLDVEQ